VEQCSYPPHWPCHQWRFANCGWMPVSHTSGQPSYSCRHPTCRASQKSHIFSSVLCHGAWTPALLSILSTGCECTTASKIETFICACRTATHQLIWQQLMCGTLGGSPMEDGVVGQPHDTPYLHPHLPSL